MPEDESFPELYIVIPQTVAVSRGDAAIDVQYDGPLNFLPY
jgi:hypothetical protein